MRMCLILLAAFLGAACEGSAGKIGLVGSFPEGRGEVWLAANLALEEASADDEKGITAKLEVVDDRGTESGAVKAARKLADDSEVLAVVLHGEPAVCPEALEIYRAAGLAVLSASSYASARPLSSTVLWMCPRQEEMASLAASYAFQMMRFKQAAVVDDGSATASAAAAAYAASFKKAGGKIVYDGEWQGSDWGLTRTAAALKANWPQVVFYAGPATEAGLLAQELANRLKDKSMLMGGPYVLEPDFAKIIKSKVKGSVAVFVSPSYRMVRRQKLNKAERKAYVGFGAPGHWGPMVFNATRLALKGLGESGEAGREGVWKYLRETRSYAGIQGKVQLGEDMSPSEPKIAIFMAWPSKKQKKKMTYLEKNYGPPWTRQR